jgi:hypothetical protein
MCSTFCFKLCKINTELYEMLMEVTVAKRSKACTVFTHSEAGIVGPNPTQGIDAWRICVCVCVCGRAHAFFCVCVQVEALRWADHRPRSPTECLRSSKPKWNEEFYGDRPRPKLGLQRQRKKWDVKSAFTEEVTPVYNKVEEIWWHSQNSRNNCRLYWSSQDFSKYFQMWWYHWSCCMKSDQWG